MNTYNLGISGSWLILILLMLAALLFTIFIYIRTNPDVSRGKKTLLAGLRSVALVLLIFSLFEPVFTGLKSSVILPKVAVLLDNSISMSLEDAAGDRKEKYLKSISNSKIDKLSEDEANFTLFGDNYRNIDVFKLDSLGFNENSTNISDAIRSIFNKKSDDNIRAVALFTDGSFNSGSNPLYISEELGLPVFTICIGDTTEPKDISIQTIILNDIAYIDNPVPVNINIKSVGFQDEILKLSIFDNNQLLDSREILSGDELFESTIYHTYIPKEAGNRKISVRIDAKDGEITEKNNSLSEYVKVLKNKRKVSLFAGAPSPDLSFIKQYLMTLPGIEISEFVQSSGSSFFKTPSETDIADTELFILIGFPVSSTPDNILDRISKELSNGKPIFLITSLNTDFNKLKKLEDNLPFNTASSRPVEFGITADFTAKAITSPIMRVEGTDDDISKWRNLPPVLRTETFVRPKPESEIIATFKVNNVPLNEPFIITRNVNSRKSVAIIGYSLFRWKLLGYAAEVSKGRTDQFDGFTKLIENSIRWLSVSELSKRVAITTTKKNYTKGEKVEFKGQVYDASYLPVDNAEISLKITGVEETRDLTMISIGNGRYIANLEGLSAGEFSFDAVVNRSSNKLGSDNGRFSIGETEIEYRNLKSDVNLLRAISEITGGKLYYNENTEKLISDIKSLKNFKEKPLTKRNDFALWSYPWLLVIAIFLFAVEWTIRKRSGML
ncbi:MAG: VWA domain-containing protein [Candidatus Kapabacteria bacterium]|nr:VWA domain-containing protein [Ignavibacteriota bacterium]MCW5885427.1 VWA domain-containing protein [Candidatus Kapabacteria bacterium]